MPYLLIGHSTPQIDPTAWHEAYAVQHILIQSYTDALAAGRSNREGFRRIAAHLVGLPQETPPQITSVQSVHYVGRHVAVEGLAFLVAGSAALESGDHEQAESRH